MAAINDPNAVIAVDTETTRGLIDMVGIAISPESAICFPFFDNVTGENYWTLEEEIEIRKLVQEILASPAKKVLQNGLYDIQYLRKEKFTLRNLAEDTMLLHHSLYPELPKGLGFLGSVYCNERSWKLLNSRKELKKDA
jgi:DNA polymerase I-like protein with 3'-5' exonuclease and polymerase domains